LRLRRHRQPPPQDRVAPLGNLIVVAFLIAHVGEDMPPRDHFKETARHIGEILAETLNASDRIAAISCAALLDDILGSAIERRFVRLGKDWQDRIFGNPAAPLSSFHSKIVIGYVMGVFGPSTRADLDIIRSVRNDFAHSAPSLSFDDKRISDKCYKIKPRQSVLGTEPKVQFIVSGEDSPRSRYIVAAQYIALQVSQDEDEMRPNFPSYLP
jgi:hypothetical protein